METRFFWFHPFFWFLKKKNSFCSLFCEMKKIFSNRYNLKKFNLKLIVRFYLKKLKQIWETLQNVPIPCIGHHDSQRLVSDTMMMMMLLFGLPAALCNYFHFLFSLILFCVFKVFLFWNCFQILFECVAGKARNEIKNFFVLFNLYMT